MKLHFVDLQMPDKQSAAKLDVIDKDANVMRIIIETSCWNNPIALLTSSDYNA